MYKALHNLNDVFVEQLFFILLHLASEASSNDRTHRLPESECGGTDLKKKGLHALRKVFFIFAMHFHTVLPNVQG